jgi:glucose-6-phosphate dehydrogenase assembly protein OpcA
MSTTLEIPEIGTEVPLDMVEQALRAFFSSDEAVTRASLINFAIYSEKPGSIAENTAIIREVTREHACRALLIAAEPEAAVLRIRSWVTAHCNIRSGGGKSVCSEQITYLLEGHSPSLVPNTVFSRLDSDLPVVFWWQGEFSARFEPTLYSRIDRLIIDSSTWQDPVAQFERLEAAYRARDVSFNVMDLAWTRILQLRLALAACFDDTASLAELATLHTLHITHSTGQALAARMLVTWMAHQAGWEFTSVSADKRKATLRMKSGQEIAVTFANNATCSACIENVTMQSAAATWSITQDASLGVWRSHVQVGGGSKEHLTPATLAANADLILERLRRGCNNALYFRILADLKRLLA